MPTRIDEISYIVVFDAADNFIPARLPFVLAFTVAVLGACVIAAALIRHVSSRRPRSGWGGNIGVLGLVATLLVVVTGSTILVLFVAMSSPSAQDTARAIESSPVVEGPVEHFHPMPSGGHDSERFEVAGVHFEYSHWSVSQGFNQDVTVGGPIQEGLYVRIHYVRLAGESFGTIVRLEIRR